MAGFGKIYKLREENKGPSITEGKITRVVRQKKNKLRVSIYLDDRFAFGVYDDLILEHQLYKDRELTSEETAQIFSEDQYFKAKATAMDYIAYKARTEQEVRIKLRQFDYHGEAIDKVIERVKELGYLNDASYAKSFAGSRLRNKGHGPRRLRADLKRKGVDEKTINIALEEVTDPDELLDSARNVAEKRWKRLEKETDRMKKRKKLYDFLIRRGFDFDIIKQVAEELQKNDSNSTW